MITLLEGGGKADIIMPTQNQVNRLYEQKLASVLELKNVVKKFDNFTAVDNGSLKIREGSFFSLLGPSGYDVKTTTLRMIGGFIDADKGDILIDSENIVLYFFQAEPDFSTK